MKIKGVICDGCGSRLRIEKFATNHTCSTCASALQVEKSGSHFYTTVLEDRVQYKQPLEEELNLKLPGENEKLNINKREYKPSLKRGGCPPKSELYAGIMLFLIVAFTALTLFNVLLENNIFYLIISTVMSIYTYLGFMETKKSQDKSS